MVAKRKRFTLMPAITLAALSLMVALPTLSNMHLYAATAQHYAVVTVQPGDTLWSIASTHTTSDGDVNETIDRITIANHIHTTQLEPGQRLRVPE
jgi:predicted Zn-dependent protease